MPYTPTGMPPFSEMSDVNVFQWAGLTSSNGASGSYVSTTTLLGFCKTVKFKFERKKDEVTPSAYQIPQYRALDIHGTVSFEGFAPESGDPLLTLFAGGSYSTLYLQSCTNGDIFVCELFNESYGADFGDKAKTDSYEGQICGVIPWYAVGGGPLTQMAVV